MATTAVGRPAHSAPAAIAYVEVLGIPRVTSLVAAA